MSQYSNIDDELQRYMGDDADQTLLASTSALYASQQETKKHQEIQQKNLEAIYTDHNTIKSTDHILTPSIFYNDVSYDVETIRNIVQKYGNQFIVLNNNINGNNNSMTEGNNNNITIQNFQAPPFYATTHNQDLSRCQIKLLAFVDTVVPIDDTAEKKSSQTLLLSDYHPFHNNTDLVKTSFPLHIDNSVFSSAITPIETVPTTTTTNDNNSNNNDATATIDQSLTTTPVSLTFDQQNTKPTTVTSGTLCMFTLTFALPQQFQLTNKINKTNHHRILDYPAENHFSQPFVINDIIVLDEVQHRHFILQSFAQLSTTFNNFFHTPNLAGYDLFCGETMNNRDNDQQIDDNNNFNNNTALIPSTPSTTTLSTSPSRPIDITLAVLNNMLDDDRCCGLYQYYHRDFPLSEHLLKLVVFVSKISIIPLVPPNPTTNLNKNTEQEQETQEQEKQQQTKPQGSINDCLYEVTINDMTGEIHLYYTSTMLLPSVGSTIELTIPFSAFMYDFTYNHPFTTYTLSPADPQYSAFQTSKKIFWKRAQQLNSHQQHAIILERQKRKLLSQNLQYQQQKKRQSVLSSTIPTTSGHYDLTTTALLSGMPNIINNIDITNNNNTDSLLSLLDGEGTDNEDNTEQIDDLLYIKQPYEYLFEHFTRTKIFFNYYLLSTKICLEQQANNNNNNKKKSLKFGHGLLSFEDDTTNGNNNNNVNINPELVIDNINTTTNDLVTGGGTLPLDYPQNYTKPQDLLSNSNTTTDNNNNNKTKNDSIYLESNSILPNDYKLMLPETLYTLQPVMLTDLKLLQDLCDGNATAQGQVYNGNPGSNGMMSNNNNNNPDINNPTPNIQYNSKYKTTYALQCYDNIFYNPTPTDTSIDINNNLHTIYKNKLLTMVTELHLDMNRLDDIQQLFKQQLNDQLNQQLLLINKQNNTNTTVQNDIFVDYSHLLSFEHTDGLSSGVVLTPWYIFDGLKRYNNIFKKTIAKVESDTNADKDGAAAATGAANTGGNTKGTNHKGPGSGPGGNNPTGSSGNNNKTQDCYDEHFFKTQHTLPLTTPGAVAAAASGNPTLAVDVVVNSAVLSSTDLATSSTAIHHNTASTAAASKAATQPPHNPNKPHHRSKQHAQQLLVQQQFEKVGLKDAVDAPKLPDWEAIYIQSYFYYNMDTQTLQFCFAHQVAPVQQFDLVNPPNTSNTANAANNKDKDNNKDGKDNKDSKDNKDNTTTPTNVEACNQTNLNLFYLQQWSQGWKRFEAFNKNKISKLDELLFNNNNNSQNDPNLLNNSKNSNNNNNTNQGLLNPVEYYPTDYIPPNSTTQQLYSTLLTHITRCIHYKLYNKHTITPYYLKLTSLRKILKIITTPILLNIYKNTLFCLKNATIASIERPYTADNRADQWQIVVNTFYTDYPEEMAAAQMSIQNKKDINNSLMNNNTGKRARANTGPRNMKINSIILIFPNNLLNYNDDQLNVLMALKPGQQVDVYAHFGDFFDNVYKYGLHMPYIAQIYPKLPQHMLYYDKGYISLFDDHVYLKSSQEELLKIIQKQQEELNYKKIQLEQQQQEQGQHGKKSTEKDSLDVQIQQQQAKLTKLQQIAASYPNPNGISSSSNNTALSLYGCPLNPTTKTSWQKKITALPPAMLYSYLKRTIWRNGHLLINFWNNANNIVQNPYYHQHRQKARLEANNPNNKNDDNDDSDTNNDTTTSTSTNTKVDTNSTTVDDVDYLGTYKPISATNTTSTNNNDVDGNNNNNDVEKYNAELKYYTKLLLKTINKQFNAYYCIQQERQLYQLTRMKLKKATLLKLKFQQQQQIEKQQQLEKQQLLEQQQQHLQQQFETSLTSDPTFNNLMINNNNAFGFSNNNNTLHTNGFTTDINSLPTPLSSITSSLLQPPTATTLTTLNNNNTTSTTTASELALITQTINNLNKDIETLQREEEEERNKLLNDQLLFYQQQELLYKGLNALLNFKENVKAPFYYLKSIYKAHITLHPWTRDGIPRSSVNNPNTNTNNANTTTKNSLGLITPSILNKEKNNKNNDIFFRKYNNNPNGINNCRIDPTHVKYHFLQHNYNYHLYENSLNLNDCTYSSSVPTPTTYADTNVIFDIIPERPSLNLKNIENVIEFQYYLVSGKLKNELLKKNQTQQEQQQQQQQNDDNSEDKDDEITGTTNVNGMTDTTTTTDISNPLATDTTAVATIQQQQPVVPAPQKRTRTGLPKNEHNRFVPSGSMNTLLPGSTLLSTSTTNNPLLMTGNAKRDALVAANAATAAAHAAATNPITLLKQEIQQFENAIQQESCSFFNATNNSTRSNPLRHHLTSASIYTKYYKDLYMATYFQQFKFYFLNQNEHFFYHHAHNNIISNFVAITNPNLKQPAVTTTTTTSTIGGVSTTTTTTTSNVPTATAAGASTSVTTPPQPPYLTDHLHILLQPTMPVNVVQEQLLTLQQDETNNTTTTNNTTDPTTANTNVINNSGIPGFVNTTNNNNITNVIGSITGASTISGILPTSTLATTGNATTAAPRSRRGGLGIDQAQVLTTNFIDYSHNNNANATTSTTTIQPITNNNHNNSSFYFTKHPYYALHAAIKTIPSYPHIYDTTTLSGECPYCFVPYTTHFSLSIHQEYHRQFEDRENFPYFCLKCKFGFDSQRIYDIHIRLFHPQYQQNPNTSSSNSGSNSNTSSGDGSNNLINIGGHLSSNYFINHYTNGVQTLNTAIQQQQQHAATLASQHQQLLLQQQQHALTSANGNKAQALLALHAVHSQHLAVIGKEHRFRKNSLFASTKNRLQHINIILRNKQRQSLAYASGFTTAADIIGKIQQQLLASSSAASAGSGNNNNNIDPNNNNTLGFTQQQAQFGISGYGTDINTLGQPGGSTELKKKTGPGSGGPGRGQGRKKDPNNTLTSPINTTNIAGIGGLGSGMMTNPLGGVVLGPDGKKRSSLGTTGAIPPPPTAPAGGLGHTNTLLDDIDMGDGMDQYHATQLARRAAQQQGVGTAATTGIDPGSFATNTFGVGATGTTTTTGMNPPPPNFDFMSFNMSTDYFGDMSNMMGLGNTTTTNTTTTTGNNNTLVSGMNFGNNTTNATNQFGINTNPLGVMNNNNTNTTGLPLTGGNNNTNNTATNQDMAKLGSLAGLATQIMMNNANNNNQTGGNPTGNMPVTRATKRLLLNALAQQYLQYQITLGKKKKVIDKLTGNIVYIDVDSDEENSDDDDDELNSDEDDDDWSPAGQLRREQREELREIKAKRLVELLAELKQRRKAKKEAKKALESNTADDAEKQAQDDNVDKTEQEQTTTETTTETTTNEDNKMSDDIDDPSTTTTMSDEIEAALANGDLEALERLQLQEELEREKIKIFKKTIRSQIKKEKERQELLQQQKDEMKAKRQEIRRLRMELLLSQQSLELKQLQDAFKIIQEDDGEDWSNDPLHPDYFINIKERMKRVSFKKEDENDDDDDEKKNDNDDDKKNTDEADKDNNKDKDNKEKDKEEPVDNSSDYLLTLHPPIKHPKHIIETKEQIKRKIDHLSSFFLPVKDQQVNIYALPLQPDDPSFWINKQKLDQERHQLELLKQEEELLKVINNKNNKDNKNTKDDNNNTQISITDNNNNNNNNIDMNKMNDEDVTTTTTTTTTAAPTDNNTTTTTNNNNNQDNQLDLLQEKTNKLVGYYNDRNVNIINKENNIIDFERQNKLLNFYDLPKPDEFGILATPIEHTQVEEAYALLNKPSLFTILSKTPWELEKENNKDKEKENAGKLKFQEEKAKVIKAKQDKLEALELKKQQEKQKQAEEEAEAVRQKQIQLDLEAAAAAAEAEAEALEKQKQLEQSNNNNNNTESLEGNTTDTTSSSSLPPPPQPPSDMLIDIIASSPTAMGDDDDTTTLTTSPNIIVPSSPLPKSVLSTGGSRSQHSTRKSVTFGEDVVMSIESINTLLVDNENNNNSIANNENNDNNLSTTDINIIGNENSTTSSSSMGDEDEDINTLTDENGNIITFTADIAEITPETSTQEIVQTIVNMNNNSSLEAIDLAMTTAEANEKEQQELLLQQQQAEAAAAAAAAVVATVPTTDNTATTDQPITTVDITTTTTTTTTLDNNTTMSDLADTTAATTTSTTTTTTSITTMTDIDNKQQERPKPPQIEAPQTEIELLNNLLESLHSKQHNLTQAIAAQQELLQSYRDVTLQLLATPGSSAYKKSGANKSTAATISAMMNKDNKDANTTAASAAAAALPSATMLAAQALNTTNNTGGIFGAATPTPQPTTTTPADATATTTTTTDATAQQQPQQPVVPQPTVQPTQILASDVLKKLQLLLTKQQQIEHTPAHIITPNHDVLAKVRDERLKTMYSTIGNTTIPSTTTTTATATATSTGASVATTTTTGLPSTSTLLPMPKPPTVPKWTPLALPSTISLRVHQQQYTTLPLPSAPGAIGLPGGAITNTGANSTSAGGFNNFIGPNGALNNGYGANGLPLGSTGTTTGLSGAGLGLTGGYTGLPTTTVPHTTTTTNGVGRPPGKTPGRRGRRPKDYYLQQQQQQQQHPHQ